MAVQPFSFRLFSVLPAVFVGVGLWIGIPGAYAQEEPTVPDSRFNTKTAPKPITPATKPQPGAVPTPPGKPATKPAVTTPVAPTPAPAAKPAVVAPAKKGPTLPPVEELRGSDLRTADGVLLHAQFYPAPGEKDKAGNKDAVPVILLHSYKRDRTEFAQLAPYLQECGHAVLVPDLRGHGASTTQQVGIAERKLDAAKFRNEDFLLMVQQDMEALKRFLRQKNNAEELNLEKLCIVGSEMGALVAINWSVLDWSWPSYPGLKQGQHVKGLVLLSPPWTLRSLTVKPMLDHPVVRSKLSVYLIAGTQNSRLYGEVSRLHKMLEVHHPEAAAPEQKDLFLKGFESKLQGADLLSDRAARVPEKIAGFIHWRLVKQDYPWTYAGRKDKGKE